MRDESNPYTAPSADPVFEPLPPLEFISKWSLPAVGLFSFVGSVIAGGLSGGIFAGRFAVVIGLVTAASASLPVTLIVFFMFTLMSPVRVRKRLAIWVAATSGGLTGFLGCLWLAWLHGSDFETLLIPENFVTAGMCAAGASVFAFLRLRPMS